MAEDFLKIKKGVELKPQAAASTGSGGEMYYRDIEGFSTNHQGFWDNLTSVSSLASAASITSSTFTQALVENSIVNLTGTTSSTLAGIAPTSVGKRIVITNDTDQTLTIQNESLTESNVAARIETPNGADLTISSTYAVELYYTGVKWKVISASGAPSGGGFKVPIGSILPTALDRADIPIGYLLCDGTAVSRTTYSKLFDKIGTSHGQGDGSTTFNLPDYRGRHLRGSVEIPQVTGAGAVVSNSGIFINHGLSTGMEVIVVSNPMTGMALNTVYYAIVLNHSNLAFATTWGNALLDIRVPISAPNNMTIRQARDYDAGVRRAMNQGGNIGDAVGTVQDDAMQQITGSMTTVASMSNNPQRLGAFSGTTTGSTDFAGNGTKGTSTLRFDSANSPGAKTSTTETRPKNAYVNFMICYDDDMETAANLDIIMTDGSMNWATARTFYRETDTNVTLTVSNAENGMVKQLTVKALGPGSTTVTLPAGTIVRPDANLVIDPDKYTIFTLTKTNGKILATVVDNLEE